MQHYLRRTLYSLAVVALFGAVLVSGCVDSFVAENAVEEEVVQQEPSKLRHWDLIDQAKQSASKDGENVGLILTLHETADAQDVLQRFSYTMDVLQRFGLTVDVLQRFGISADVLQRFGITDDVLQRFYVDVLQRFNWDVLQRFDTVQEAVNALIIEMPPELAEFVAMLLERHPDIKWIEPDIALDPTDPMSPVSSVEAAQIEPWALSYIGAQAGRNADGVEVYIIDTGVSSDDVNMVEGVDFTNESETNTADDNDGHGTHIAGLIGAIDDADGVVGVAPGARIHALKVLGPDGQVKVSYVLEALDHVVAAKKASPSTPMVVNISLGADVETTEYNALDEAVEAAVEAGVVVVVAAGNAGIDAATVTPAHVAKAITVGAYGQTYQFAGFSNYGPVVDLMAPGVDLKSLISASKESYAPYAIHSGTSMAAGVVTGAVAVALAKYPTATPAQIEAGLKSVARPEVYKVPTGTTDKTLWIGSN